MRDPANRLPELADLLARDLAHVHWPAPDGIRARARRRSLRTALAAPLAVLVLVTSVWLLARPAENRAIPGPAASVTPTATRSLETTEPPGWVGAEVLVRPADVGAGYGVDNVYTYAPGEYPTWQFDLQPCAAYNALGVTAYRDYTWMGGHTVAKQVTTNTPGDVHAQLMRYPDSAAAARVVADVRRVVRACANFDDAGGEASTEERPARVVHRYGKIDEGFAGDESLLLRHRVEHVDASTGKRLPDHQNASVEMIAVVRVGDLVEILLTDQDDPARMRRIAVAAARHL
jgi:hypothetical protein